jgi:phosphoribosylformylglycinamidine cyclo-ligase
LVRRVIAHAGWALDREVADFGRTLGEELLTPTRVYAADLVDLLRDPSVVAGGGVHGLSHVTGGGLAANLARVLPQGLHARIDRASWTHPGVLDHPGTGNVLVGHRTDLNQGVGFVVVVPRRRGRGDHGVLGAHGIPTWVMGGFMTDRAPIDAGHEVIHGAKGVDGGSVQIVGAHR